jgi:hypothetical protein
MGGSPAPIPPTVSWNGSGGTTILSNTQKYWLGSLNRFQGKCTQRMADTWYTNRITLGSITTPITDDSSAGPCAQGKFAN